MTARKRVLVIAYFFPPLGGGGVQRALKFVKYLPDFGYQPTVLTTSDRLSPVDETMLSEVPAEVNVVRAGDVRLLRRAARFRGTRRLRRKIPLFGWPDARAPWILPAARAAMEVGAMIRADAIFSTSPPNSAHLVALVAAKRLNVPWIADFRDPWLDEELGPLSSATERFMATRGERLVARRAVRRVRAYNSIELAEPYGTSGRIVTILNGVDDGDFSSDQERGSSRRFRLTHVGTLYDERDCSPILEALERLLHAGAVLPDEIDVRVVGVTSIQVAARIGQLTDDLGRSQVAFTEVGYVDHARAIEEMLDATVLMFHVPLSWETAPSGKIFEYLASGRPILCVASRNNLAYRLVEEYEAGVAVEPDDSEAVERALLALVSKWREGGVPTDFARRHNVLARFSRRAAARQLSGLFDDAIRATEGGRRED